MEGQARQNDSSVERIRTSRAVAVWGREELNWSGSGSEGLFRALVRVSTAKADHIPLGRRVRAESSSQGPKNGSCGRRGLIREWSAALASAQEKDENRRTLEPFLVT